MTVETEPAPRGAGGMSKAQKLATLLIILGAEAAAQILRMLDEDEVATVTAEMARITIVTQEMRTEVLQEFTEIAVQAGSSVAGGVDFAKNALEKSFGPVRATTLISRLAPAPATPPCMQPLLDLETQQLANLLKPEQPQTIALITTYLPTTKGSELLALLPNDIRHHVLERIATMAPTPIEVVERVVELLNRRLSGRTTSVLNQTGGLKNAADVLNSLDKNISKSVLISLEERNPELGAAIRQKMFTFDDLGELDAGSLQKVMREVDMRDLAVALKNASERVRKALLACISKRAAETVNEEMTFMGPLRLRDIEASQNRIIEVVRRLEAEGEIELGNSGDSGDELVA